MSSLHFSDLFLRMYSIYCNFEFLWPRDCEHFSIDLPLQNFFLNWKSPFFFEFIGKLWILFSQNTVLCFLYLLKLILYNIQISTGPLCYCGSTDILFILFRFKMKEIGTRDWMHIESACCSRVVPWRADRMEAKNEKKKTNPWTFTCCLGIIICSVLLLVRLE